MFYWKVWYLLRFLKFVCHEVLYVSSRVVSVCGLGNSVGRFCNCVVRGEVSAWFGHVLLLQCHAMLLYVACLSLFCYTSYRCFVYLCTLIMMRVL